MCGIALIISNSENLVDSSLSSFQANLAHRGPDGSNILKEKQIINILVLPTQDYLLLIYQAQKSAYGRH